MDWHVWVGVAVLGVLALGFVVSFFIRPDARVVNQISSDSAAYRKTRLPLDADTQTFLGNDGLDGIPGREPRD